MAFDWISTKVCAITDVSDLKVDVLKRSDVSMLAIEITTDKGRNPF